MLTLNTTSIPTESAVTSFVLRAYGWMAAGLFTTALVAGYTAMHPEAVGVILGSRSGFWILALAQIGVVMALSWAINRISSTVATALFFLYAALTGLTFSVLLMIYTAASIVGAFFACSLTFAATGAYGLITKRDLTSVGSFCFMGLIGVIIASVLNMLFFRGETLAMAINYITVLVFVGLSAYDAQKLKLMAAADLEGEEVGRKAAIMGALELYLDFINLFLAILRIFGRRR